MKRIVFLAAAVAGWPAWAAADIYKCTDTSMIVYQSRPCVAGQVQTVLRSPTATTPAAKPAPTTIAPTTIASGVPPPASRGVPAPAVRDVAFRRTTLALGMSDDEVLNLPGWGVPKRIERSRDGRVYREAWHYERADGTVRLLYFANARLTGMDAGDAPATQMVGFSSQ